ncbi:molybdopterin molybdotransferase MoeA [Cytophaga sp. FL35]|uniref:molybdopterin molybdotransferase MoeA n=1 Tax=Cytophaga sp. FL35 TaxID=1904456 RepID=UPI0016537AC1|nr:molybdopterin molybdotransferase MoeA [Cytophaga sp. FL35]MBC6997927.1 molybdopterin molybdotransferase MoeA [Cytophaga sp. FL35]
MISFEEAFEKILSHTINLGTETLPLLSSTHRILAEDIMADRDFPPFNRSTKDGIAINYRAIENGITEFPIQGILSAGMPQQRLENGLHCLEIMTGAVLPHDADTIIMYEETEISKGIAKITSIPKKGQNIHSRGSDIENGEIILKKGTQITAAVIGVLASVGKHQVLVQKAPRICVISTGNELVEVQDTPEPHQIRKSNVISLSAALSNQRIAHELVHLPDVKEAIESKLKQVLEDFDVLMLSGGVSKGKFDYIPEVLDSLGVEKIFHRVAQRPGKPFWFGRHEKSGSVVFSFPGNPVSTFANYHVYFLSWLKVMNGDISTHIEVTLQEEVNPHPTLTLFLQVQTFWNGSQLHATLLKGNGSGDLVSLAQAHGFIKVPTGEKVFEKGQTFTFYPAS